MLIIYTIQQHLDSIKSEMDRLREKRDEKIEVLTEEKLKLTEKFEELNANYSKQSQDTNVLIWLQVIPISHQDTLRLWGSKRNHSSELKAEEISKGQTYGYLNSLPLGSFFLE